MSIKLLTATILAAALTTPAFAQQADPAPGGQSNMPAAGAAADMDYGRIATDLQSGTESPDQWASELAAIDDSATVEIVKLSELKGETTDNGAALDTALMNAKAGLDAARTEIEGKSQLTSALQAEQYTADDVVAVMVEGSEVTLVVDDDKS